MEQIGGIIFSIKVCNRNLRYVLWENTILPINCLKIFIYVLFSTLNSLIKEVLQKHFNDVNMNMKMLDLLIMQD